MTIFVQWLKCEDVKFFFFILCIYLPSFSCSVIYLSIHAKIKLMHVFSFFIYRLDRELLVSIHAKIKLMHVFSFFIYRLDRELLETNDQYLPKIVAVFAEVSLYFWID